MVLSSTHPSTNVYSADVSPGSIRPSGPRTRSQRAAASTGEQVANEGASSGIATGSQPSAKRRKSLAVSRKSSQEVDLNAPASEFIAELSDDSDGDANQYHGSDNPLFWHAFAGWEVLPTGLGDINAIYFKDESKKFFTHLREILHLVDRKDLLLLYEAVVKQNASVPLKGSGLILWVI